jgi:hypothetical protein
LNVKDKVDIVKEISMESETKDFKEAEIEDAALAYIRWQEENPDVWGDQDENGVDLLRLRENLKLTPAERLQKLDRSRWIYEIPKNARNKITLR